jgi:hypothetical protein
MTVLERVAELLRAAVERIRGPRLVPAPAPVRVTPAQLVRPARLVDR